MIAEMKPSGALIIHGIFHVREGNSQEEWSLPFNEEIRRSIERRTVVAAIDASVKDGRMGGN